MSHRSGAATSAQELPKSVQLCANRGGSDAFLYRWRGDQPSVRQRVPFTCGTWRCEGACRRYDASVAFARISEAIGPDPKGWVFVVLTLDRHGFYSRKPWADAREAFAALSQLSNRLMHRWRRHMAKVGWTDCGNRWVATVEVHRTGWPHVNVLLYCPEWAAELRRHDAAAEKAGQTRENRRMMRGEWRRHAMESGWGRRSWAEGVRINEAVADYIVKLAGEADQTAGELAKLTQLPLNAPKRFRRLRSGKKFLPPRRKGKVGSGTFIRRGWMDGTPQAVPVHRVKGELRERSAECATHETGLHVSELAGESKAPPTVSYWICVGGVWRFANPAETAAENGRRLHSELESLFSATTE